MKVTINLNNNLVERINKLSNNKDINDWIIDQLIYRIETLEDLQKSIENDKISYKITHPSYEDNINKIYYRDGRISLIGNDGEDLILHGKRLKKKYIPFLRNDLGISISESEKLEKLIFYRNKIFKMIESSNLYEYKAKLNKVFEIFNLDIHSLDKNNWIETLKYLIENYEFINLNKNNKIYIINGDFVLNLCINSNNFDIRTIVNNDLLMINLYSLIPTISVNTILSSAEFLNIDYDRNNYINFVKKDIINEIFEH